MRCKRRLPHIATRTETLKSAKLVLLLSAVSSVQTGEAQHENRTLHPSALVILTYCPQAPCRLAVRPSNSRIDRPSVLFCFLSDRSTLRLPCASALYPVRCPLFSRRHSGACVVERCHVNRSIQRRAVGPESGVTRTLRFSVPSATARALLKWDNLRFRCAPVRQAYVFSIAGS